MSPTRAVLWKEFRQQRAVLVAGIALVACTPALIVVLNGVGTMSPADNLRATAFALIFVIWPVLAAVTGSATIAGEHESRTLSFLLSRPVSRARAWGSKVAVAAAVLLAVASMSILFLAFLERSVSISPVQAVGPAMADFLPAAVSFTALQFACAVLCSTFLPRPLTAAAASFALALLINLILTRAGAAAASLVMVAVVALLASLGIFVHQRRGA